MRHLVDRAIRIALGERRVTAIILPNDLQDDAVRGAAAQARHGAFRRRLLASRRSCPTRRDLRRAAEVLNAGKKVAILVGAGALHATDEVIAVADRLGAGVAKALLGKAALPDDLPWVTGSIGLLGTKPSYDLMTECDTLLMIGSGFPYSEFLPKEGQARGVQIDIDARHAVACAIRWRSTCVGDAAETLRALLPLLQAEDRPRLARADREGRRDWWKTLEDARDGSRRTRSTRSASPGNCRRACRSARSSPAIPAPAPTGMRATSRCGAA